MPRISFVSNKDFRKGLSLSPENENFDLCIDCWCHRRSFVPEGLRGTRWVDGDDDEGTEHPAYGDDSWYRCEKCGKILTDVDN